jgi:hypothetical protein
MRQRFGEGFVYLIVTLCSVAVLYLLLIVQWQIILHGIGWSVQSLLFICCNAPDISLICDKVSQLKICDFSGGTFNGFEVL